MTKNCVCSVYGWKSTRWKNIVAKPNWYLIHMQLWCCWTMVTHTKKTSTKNYYMHKKNRYFYSVCYSLSAFTDFSHCSVYVQPVHERAYNIESSSLWCDFIHRRKRTQNAQFSKNDSLPPSLSFSPLFQSYRNTHTHTHTNYWIKFVHERLCKRRKIKWKNAIQTKIIKYK